MRDIEDAFRDESGRLLLSRTAVSEIGARLWADYQEFARRDLSEYDITYLFVDGIAERLRPGQRREPVLAAWGHTSSGAKVLLHLMPVPRRTPRRSPRSSRTCGRGAWAIRCSSSPAPGIVEALETCFPRSERQRCLAHRVRNLAAKVPEDRWPEFKDRATACYQGRRVPSPVTSRPAQLMFGAMIRAAERWRAVKVTEFERRQMAAVP